VLHAAYTSSIAAAAGLTVPPLRACHGRSPYVINTILPRALGCHACLVPGRRVVPSYSWGFFLVIVSKQHQLSCISSLFFLSFFFRRCGKRTKKSTDGKMQISTKDARAPAPPASPREVLPWRIRACRGRAPPTGDPFFPLFPSALPLLLLFVQKASNLAHKLRSFYSSHGRHISCARRILSILASLEEVVGRAWNISR
jgi:hypothetical protein